VCELKTHYHPLLSELFQAIAVENRDPSRTELFRGDMRREIAAFDSAHAENSEKLLRFGEFLPSFVEFVAAYDFNAEDARDRFMHEEIAIAFEKTLYSIGAITADMHRSEFRKIVILGDGDYGTCEFDPTENDRGFPIYDVPIKWQLFAICKALKETCRADKYQEKTLNTFTALARYPYIQGESFGAALAYIESYGYPPDIPIINFAHLQNDYTHKHDTMYIFSDGSIQCVALYGVVIPQDSEEPVDLRIEKPADFVLFHTVKSCSPSGHYEAKSAGFAFRVPHL
jgi:hypothetical protein